MDQIKVVDHPLVQHMLTQCRKVETEPYQFRGLVEEITSLLLYEATRDLELTEVELETPVCSATGPVLQDYQPVFIAILRAGLGMLGGALSMFPGARAGHIGLYRDHDTFKPVEYYWKLPEGVEKMECYLLEPMLATGGSAIHAISALKKFGVSNIKLLSLIASPEGIEAIKKNHPEVKVYLAAIDEKLNEKAYIVPGLGDAGDRIFGTN